MRWLIAHASWWSGVAALVWLDDCRILRLTDGWEGAYDCFSPTGLALVVTALGLAGSAALLAAQGVARLVSAPS